MRGFCDIIVGGGSDNVPTRGNYSRPLLDSSSSFAAPKFSAPILPCLRDILLQLRHTVTPAGAIAMYELEWQTYRDQRERLLATAAGDFVVIRGAEILGTYPTLAEAYSAKVKAYGLERAFLQRISESEPELYELPSFIGMPEAGSKTRYPAS
jgi:hypothetical protein